MTKTLLAPVIARKSLEKHLSLCGRHDQHSAVGRRHRRPVLHLGKRAEKSQAVNRRSTYTTPPMKPSW